MRRWTTDDVSHVNQLLVLMMFCWPEPMWPQSSSTLASLKWYTCSGLKGRGSCLVCLCKWSGAEKVHTYEWFSAPLSHLNHLRESYWPLLHAFFMYYSKCFSCFSADRAEAAIIDCRLHFQTVPSVWKQVWQTALGHRVWSLFVIVSCRTSVLQNAVSLLSSVHCGHVWPWSIRRESGGTCLHMMGW